MNTFRKWLLAVVAYGLATAACGGGSKPAPAPVAPPAEQTVAAPKCNPNGTTIELSATKSAFDKDCLAVPADTAFNIALDNKDPYRHDLAIFRDADGRDLVFRGEAVKGQGGRTYQVAALPAGIYFFRCDYHFLMKGTLVVAD